MHIINVQNIKITEDLFFFKCFSVLSVKAEHILSNHYFKQPLFSNFGFGLSAHVLTGFCNLA